MERGGATIKLLPVFEKIVDPRLSKNKYRCEVNLLQCSKSGISQCRIRVQSDGAGGSLSPAPPSAVDASKKPYINSELRGAVITTYGRAFVSRVG
ncbi:hypothetical protein EVAR_13050_1 [Eumeta japonica]|uniref:Uncharacterized protein n=1 Tax=Eumeta variegata TaxID=151549 RepID=A0A4C1VHD2_EUMVA|nr:hypothetical protein EVAR_13050_1 [Eumeta japonica]